MHDFYYNSKLPRFSLYRINFEISAGILNDDGNRVDLSCSCSDNFLPLQ